MKKTISKSIPSFLKGFYNKIALEIVLLSCIVGAYVIFYWVTTPVFINTTYLLDGENRQVIETEFPVTRESGANGFTVETTMILFPLHTNQFLVVPDDCITEWKINDVSVDLQDKKICWEKGATVDLSQYLSSGMNHMVIHVKDNGGRARFFMQPSTTKGLMLIPNIILLIAIFLYGYFRLL